MAFSPAELSEFARIAIEALGRYRLRTTLSVVGIVLGIAAVIAMMSVTEGAERQALAQVDMLGLNNVVVRATGLIAPGVPGGGLTAADAQRLAHLVPNADTVSPVALRTMAVAYAGRTVTAQVLGVRADFRRILHLSNARGRFLSITDEREAMTACVLGAVLAEELFAGADPVGHSVRLGTTHYDVAGVLDERGSPDAANAIAWHDVNRAVFVPLPVLTGRSLALQPGQAVNEIWLQVESGDQAVDAANVLQRVLERTHKSVEFSVVIPRELLAQRYRTQRTLSVVIGSIAALALIIGGIGIMNVMLASVVERTREIGVRRTVGATRRDVGLQFMIETLLMTMTGGAIGLGSGTAISWGITRYAGWATHVSMRAAVLGLFVSFSIGLVVGVYPAVKAAGLEPVDALRHE